MPFLPISRYQLSRAFVQPWRQFILGISSQSFHSSGPRSVLKESDRHRDEHPNMANEIEKHKQAQIRRQREGKGNAGWVEELASSSEENVKADRGEIHDATFDKIQEKVKEGKGKAKRS
ncbi:hypothetical protein LOZ53_004155 [Ophidiomyces ophidiicola]|nr:hypothetical protein LOZ53_004155 [Ophidiomyces ophidiicola]KAI1989469.1 hypothetical protein LOZ54_002879 [Ophidiomyces ophidiicola]KAI1990561.1 hypothetical protein LOZ51_004912 [Ophidiomyces ophidiicola]